MKVRGAVKATLFFYHSLGDVYSSSITNSAAVLICVRIFNLSCNVEVQEILTIGVIFGIKKYGRAL